MARPMFILNGENDQIGTGYVCSWFPKIPNFRKQGSWFLLTEGIRNDLVVDDRTTVRDIRRGQYKRLVEISRNTLAFAHAFMANSDKASYSFKVTVKAHVFVNDPVIFCANVRSINVLDFLNNQFSLDVKKVTRNYSILNYGNLDDELTQVLTRSTVTDITSGLSYRIATVTAVAGDEAKKVIREQDDMSIRDENTKMARNIARSNHGKTFKEAVLEEVAKGNLSYPAAIEHINNYEKKNIDEKLELWERLRDKGIISDADFAAKANGFLSLPQPQTAENRQLQSRDEGHPSPLFTEGPDQDA